VLPSLFVTRLPQYFAAAAEGRILKVVEAEFFVAVGLHEVGEGSLAVVQEAMAVVMELSHLTPIRRC